MDRFEELVSLAVFDKAMEKELQEMLRKNPELLLRKTPMGDGSIFLQHLARSGDYDWLHRIVRRLSKSFDINYSDNSGNTVLDYALGGIKKDVALISTIRSMGGVSPLDERRRQREEERVKEEESVDALTKKPETFDFGGFHIINAGLPETKMRKVLGNLGKMASKLKSKGFGNLIYGDIFVTANELKGKTYNDKYQKYKDTKWAAVYYAGSDFIVVNADNFLRDKSMKVLAHELGHREWFKFLSGNQRKAWNGDFDDRSMKVTKKDADLLIAIMNASAKKRRDAFGKTFTDWNTFNYSKFLKSLSRFPDVRKAYTAISLDKYRGNEKTARRKMADYLLFREGYPQGGPTWSSTNIFPLAEYLNGTGRLEDIPSKSIRRHPDTDSYNALKSEMKPMRIDAWVGRSFSDPESVSDYGRQNSREDFAEAFSAFITNSPMPERVYDLFMRVKTASRQGMDKIVGELLRVAELCVNLRD